LEALWLGAATSTTTHGRLHAESISADVAAEHQVTQRFVRGLIADGERRAVKVGSRLLRINRDDVEAVLRKAPVPTRCDR
jgi:excisionase family DNA binding protein